MKKILLGSMAILLLLNSIAKGQENLNISESRKQNLKKILDYRYKGGYYSFEQLFNKTVEYPETALQNCMMGIIIASFEVKCNGEIERVSMKNIIKFGIDDEITKFFNATKGQWNTCEDERYTRFDIPIQFRINDVETDTTDAILVKKGTTQGYSCNDDKYFLKKANKLLDKGKGKKALEYINILIMRNPYNIEYPEMRDKAASMIK
jgi:hypothetical protein